MSWSKVGDWLKDNAGSSAALVGSLLTGNVPGAIAAGVSMVSGATGTDDPLKALEAMKADPSLVIKLEQIKNDRQSEVNRHIESIALAKIEDEQRQHETTARVIVDGQKVAEGWFEKNSRPAMAWVSLLSTVTYGFYALQKSLAVDLVVLGAISGGYLAWMGLRTIDKKNAALGLPVTTLAQKVKGLIK